MHRDYISQSRRKIGSKTHGHNERKEALGLFKSKNIILNVKYLFGFSMLAKFSKWQIFSPIFCSVERKNKMGPVHTDKWSGEETIKLKVWSV